MSNEEMMGMLCNKGPLPDVRCSMTWPRVVLPESETPIEVVYGDLPLSWELLSGVGFSLKFPGATGRENILVCEGGGCGRALTKVTDTNGINCTCWTVSTAGSFQNESTGTCGGTTGESSDPQYIPISYLYRWKYFTDPDGTGFCTGWYGPCGYIDCAPLEDGIGKVCAVICERWKCD